jgi:N-acetylneuraminic acid mutarotase
MAHAAATALGGTLYVIGGRAGVGASVRRAILAVDPRSGKVRAAGVLPTALSDVAAAALAGRVWVIGGRDARGGVHDEVLEYSADSPR